MNYFDKINELTSFIEAGKYLQTRTPLYSPVRLDPGTAGTLPAAQTYTLFDRETVQNMGWGSGGVAGAVSIQDNLDFPEWFVMKQRVMAKDKYYIAEFLSISWTPLISTAAAAGSKTVNAAFGENKLKVINSDSYIEIRPNDKPVQWYIPLRDIGDATFDEPRAYPGSLLTASAYTHSAFDKFGGKVPMFPDDNTPGLFFTPDDVISVLWTVRQTLPTMVGEIRLRFQFDGWYYRPL